MAGGVQDAPIATVVVAPDGAVSGWSEGGWLLLGWTAEELVGRPVRDLLVDPPAGFPEHGGVSSDPSVHTLVRHRDGSVVDSVVTVLPLTGGDGGPMGHVLTVQRWGRRPVIADRAFEQCPFALGVYDPELRFLWVNASACRMLAHSEEQLLGEKYRDLFPELDDPEPSDAAYSSRLAEVVRTGEPARHITVHRALGSNHANAWATSMWPVRDAQGTIRAVADWGFDLSAEYWARERLLLLGEAGRGIGRTLDVIGTAEELASVSVPEFADVVTVDLFAEVLRGDEPPPAEAITADGAVTLRRAARRGGRQEVNLEPGAPPPVRHRVNSVAVRCMTAGRSTVQLAAPPSPDGEWGSGPGLSADPAHWPPGNPVIDGTIAAEGLTGRMTVPLLAHGALLGVVAFARRDRPGSFTADDLILAEELAAKTAVAIDNARRYARERATALTLQRALLPRRLPSQEAIEVASGYRPAGTGSEVGGDWYDVIPLSGARVALVVGDVVGHGLHASASMGRLRTAVRTLADVDLPPDELLTHLDDLVGHLSSDRQPAGQFDPAGEFGATCLYAVYDPVSRRCTLASAGHPLPLVVSPDGTRIEVSAQPGPPLGVGGLPFEAVEFDLPEGSLFALYTDGLVTSREREADQGVAELLRILTRPAPSLADLCDQAMAEVLSERRTDDAALLVARTHALSADRVAQLDIEPDFAQVAHARQFAADQLAAWGLADAAFVTELVVSELVTNAIRYGTPPISLRLIRDTALICEVSDGSNTSPHLRRARTFDEGGRGLLLVAQLTQGWGTRQSARGKTIWCAQALGGL